MTPKTDGCELITLCSYTCSKEGTYTCMVWLWWNVISIFHLYLWSVLSDKRWPGRRRPNFPQTSDTPEGQAQLRAFQRQRTQGPGRYESASSHILHLPKKDLYVPSYLKSYIFSERWWCCPTNLQVLQEIPLWILWIDKSTCSLKIDLVNMISWPSTVKKLLKSKQDIMQPWGIILLNCSWLRNPKWLRMFIYTSTHVSLRLSA